MRNGKKHNVVRSDKCSFPLTGGELIINEKYIEQLLVRTVRVNGGIAPKFVSPGMAGMPDRLILMPDGHMAFVEVKAPGMKPRPLQESRHRKLCNLGYRVYVLADVKQIDKLVQEVKA